MEKVHDREVKNSGSFIRLIYYIVLFGIVFGVLFSQQEENGPKVIFGYGAFHVISGSMEPDIPKDSLVITKKTDFAKLSVGDDITFMIGPTASITHRIINVVERYNDTEETILETQGVANGTKDNSPVHEENIIGKVIFSNYYFGKVTIFLNKYWHILLVYMAGFIILKTIVFKFINNNNEEDEDEDEFEYIEYEEYIKRKNKHSNSEIAPLKHHYIEEELDDTADRQERRNDFSSIHEVDLYVDDSQDFDFIEENLLEPYSYGEGGIYSVEAVEGDLEFQDYFDTQDHLIFEVEEYHYDQYEEYDIDQYEAYYHDQYGQAQYDSNYHDQYEQDYYDQYEQDNQEYYGAEYDNQVIQSEFEIDSYKGQDITQHYHDSTDGYEYYNNDIDNIY